MGREVFQCVIADDVVVVADDKDDMQEMLPMAHIFSQRSRFQLMSPSVKL